MDEQIHLIVKDAPDAETEASGLGIVEVFESLALAQRFIQCSGEAGLRLESKTKGDARYQHLMEDRQESYLELRAKGYVKTGTDEFTDGPYGDTALIVKQNSLEISEECCGFQNAPSYAGRELIDFYFRLHVPQDQTNQNGLAARFERIAEQVLKQALRLERDKRPAGDIKEAVLAWTKEELGLVEQAKQEAAKEKAKPQAPGVKTK